MMKIDLFSDSLEHASHCILQQLADLLSPHHQRSKFH